MIPHGLDKDVYSIDVDIVVYDFLVVYSEEC